jgi:hypothetical protein
VQELLSVCPQYEFGPRLDIGRIPKDLGEVGGRNRLATMLGVQLAFKFSKAVLPLKSFDVWVTLALAPGVVRGIHKEMPGFEKG